MGISKKVDITPLYTSPAGEKKVMAVYEDILANWNKTPETYLISTRQGDTFVIACGDKKNPPLVLLHGMDSNALFWLNDMLNYRKYFRVYAVDLIGEPGKSAPNRPNMTDNSFSEWMEDIIKALQIKKTSLLGLSLGAWIAIKLAITRPEYIHKLVLMSPAGVVDLRPSLAWRLLPLKVIGSKGFKPTLDLVFGHQPIPDNNLRFSLAMMPYFKSRKRPVPVFKDEELKRLVMPNMLIVSKQDSVFDSAKIVLRLKSLLPDLKVIFLPDAGHTLYGRTGDIIPFLIE
jgi:pimeloyl-ACP methyl ester carboxylesterase